MWYIVRSTRYLGKDHTKTGKFYGDITYSIIDLARTPAVHPQYID